jgi:hypothetical protein
MSAREQLAEITRMEEQAAALGLADQLNENFAIMRREAVATGSGWDKQNEDLEGQLAEKDQRSQANKKDLERRQEEAQKDLDEIAIMEAQAKELGIYDKLEENFSIMRREAVDDLEVGSEVLGFINSAREGASFGVLGDEARAAGRLAPYLMLSAYTKALPTDLLGEKYTEFVGDERAREKEFVDDHGAADFIARFGGGLASGSALSRAFGVGQSAKEGALRQGGAAGIEGFLYGFSEGDGDFEKRLVDGLKLGGGTALLGSGFGAIAGRAEGNIAKNEAQRQELLKIRQKKVAELNRPTSDSNEVIDQATRYLSEVAEDYTRQTGKPLTGADYGIALRQMQQETGLSTKRLRHAEMETGRELIDFRKATLEELRAKNSKLADEVGFTSDGYNPSKLKRWVTKAIRPLAKHGEQWVSKAFGGSIQRTAGNIVQRQYFAEQAMKTQPILNFQKASAQDKEIQRRILNMSNIKKKNPNKNFAERKEQYDALVAHIRKGYGDQADDLLDGMKQIQAQLQKTNAGLRRSVDGDIPQDPYYWPSVFKKDGGYASERGPSSRQNFTSEYEQNRNLLEVGDSLLPNYEEPVIAAMSHIRKAIAQTEAFDQMRLKNYAATRAELRAATQQGTKKQRNEAKRKLDSFENQIRTGQRLQIEMQNALKDQGAGAQAQDAAGDTLNTLIVYGQRGPDAWISNLRKAAYMGTIGNPYSAVLNLGDIANSFVNFGAENTVAAMRDMFAKRGITMTVEDVGLANQATGEFLQENVGKWTQRFSAASDQVFQKSGFRAVDQFGKNVAMNAALKKGKELIRKGKFDDEWGFAFTPNEMARLKRDLMRGEKTDIVKEFAAANIARLQPSNMAQMPKWYLERPDWRVLWMLKTFAMKQIDQLERLVVQEWKNGNKKDAMKNALAYMFVVGGTNAALMEGRQAIKGDVPDPANFPARYRDWALGVASINLLSSYQLEKSRQDGAAALVPSITPIGEMVMAPAADVITYAGDPDKMDEFLEDSETLGWLPFGRLVQSWIEDD